MSLIAAAQASFGVAEVLAIFALVVFLVAAFVGSIGRVALVPIGLALLTLAFLFGF